MFLLSFYYKQFKIQFKKIIQLKAIKEKDRYPLFILPKGDDLHKFNSDDYHNLMHYILNTYIMHYYKRLHSVHRDRVSFLIDRSGHSWNEVHKFLEGISVILVCKFSLLNPTICCTLGRKVKFCL